MKLTNLDATTYAREVLPHTAALWAGPRDFDSYVRHTHEIISSGYGRRHFRTLGLYEGKHLVSSFKRYERSLHHGTRRLNAIGIGAVHTPEAFRGRGYASAMLAMLLDGAKSEGADLAYLFSDIRPQFYEDLGFKTLPSRSMSLRADGLDSQRVEVQRLEEHDWTGLRRCFELGERSRPWGFIRTPLVWEWQRLQMRQRSEHGSGMQMNLVVRRGRGIAAYVFGVRSPEHDAYLLDEFGFADAEAARLIRPLLRAAAGDFRRVVGWLPPDHVRDVLARPSVRKRTTAIFMAVPLTANGKRWLGIAAAPKSGDGVWSTDHI